MNVIDVGKYILRDKNCFKCSFILSEMPYTFSEWLLITGIGIVSIVILTLLGAYWQLIRDFFHTRYSFFDFIFIILYFFEQLLLVILSYLYPKYMAFWLTSFALIVITTVSLQKLLMDSKDKKVSELAYRYYDLSLELDRKLLISEEENEALRKRNSELVKIIENLEKKG